MTDESEHVDPKLVSQFHWAVELSGNKGRLADALEAYRRVLDLQVAENLVAAPRFLAQTRLQLTYVLIDLGQLELARDELLALETSVFTAAQLYEYYFTLGNIYGGLRQPREMFQHLVAAISAAEDLDDFTRRPTQCWDKILAFVFAAEDWPFAIEVAEKAQQVARVRSFDDIYTKAALVLERARKGKSTPDAPRLAAPLVYEDPPPAISDQARIDLHLDRVMIHARAHRTRAVLEHVRTAKALAIASSDRAANGWQIAIWKATIDALVLAEEWERVKQLAPEALSFATTWQVLALQEVARTAFTRALEELAIPSTSRPPWDVVVEQITRAEHAQAFAFLVDNRGDQVLHANGSPVDDFARSDALTKRVNDLVDPYAAGTAWEEISDPRGRASASDAVIAALVARCRAAGVRLTRRLPDAYGILGTDGARWGIDVAQDDANLVRNYVTGVEQARLGNHRDASVWLSGLLHIQRTSGRRIGRKAIARAQLLAATATAELGDIVGARFELSFLNPNELDSHDRESLSALLARIGPRAPMERTRRPPWEVALELVQTFDDAKALIGMIAYADYDVLANEVPIAVIHPDIPIATERSLTELLAAHLGGVPGAGTWQPRQLLTPSHDGPDATPVSMAQFMERTRAAGVELRHRAKLPSSLPAAIALGATSRPPWQVVLATITERAHALAFTALLQNKGAHVLHANASPVDEMAQQSAAGTLPDAARVAMLIAPDEGSDLKPWRVLRDTGDHGVDDNPEETRQLVERCRAAGVVLAHHTPATFAVGSGDHYYGLDLAEDDPELAGLYLRGHAAFLEHNYRESVAALEQLVAIQRAKQRRFSPTVFARACIVAARAHLELGERVEAERMLVIVDSKMLGVRERYDTHLLRALNLRVLGHIEVMTEQLLAAIRVTRDPLIDDRRGILATTCWTALLDALAAAERWDSLATHARDAQTHAERVDSPALAAAVRAALSRAAARSPNVDRTP